MLLCREGAQTLSLVMVVIVIRQKMCDMERHVSQLQEDLFRPWDRERAREEEVKVKSEKDGELNNKIHKPHPSQSMEKLNKEKNVIKSEQDRSSDILRPHPSQYNHPTPPSPHPAPLSIMRGLQYMMCPPPSIGLSLPPVDQMSHLMQYRAVQELQVAAKKRRQKKYKCDQCNASFSNNGQLRGHVRIHTGNQNFMKNLAVKMFSTSLKNILGISLQILT